MKTKSNLPSGAEADVYVEDGVVIKHRPPKTYRHSELDRRIRQFRTRRESKVLEKLSIPQLISVDDKEMKITMQFLDGPQLRDVLDQTNVDQFATQIGKIVRKMHDKGVVHGDLTTSNMIVVNEEIHLIDFGLAQFSEKIEDKAVDLHLLKQSLSAKHPDLDVWDGVKDSYGMSKDLEVRFIAVESRGRNKQKC